MTTYKRLFILVLVALTMFGLQACSESSMDRNAPDAPTNLQVFAMDSNVEISWQPSSASDLAGYNVYYSTSYDGRYEQIGSTSNTIFYDTEAVNGDLYFYAVTAYDNNGNESELSYDEVTGIPRPEGMNQIVYNYTAQPNMAGFFFDENRVVAYDALETDFFYEIYEGVPYIDVWRGEAELIDMGPTDSIYDITEAPESGYLLPVNDDDTIVYAEAIVGHTYVIWTIDNHFAKIRINSKVNDRISFDWAYQMREGERALKDARVRSAEKVFKVTR